MIPATLQAGDSLGLEYYDENYPSSEWTVTLSLRGPSAINIVYAVNPDVQDGHLATVAAAVTALYLDGIYDAIFVAVKGLERKVIESGKTQILQDLSAISTAYDARSHVKKVLDAINAVLENIASTDQQQMMIDGRQLTRFSHYDLLRFRMKYQELYNEELAANSGKKRGSPSLVKFAL